MGDDELDRIVINGAGFDRSLRTERGADQAGQGNDHIGFGRELLDQWFIANIAADNKKLLVMHTVEQAGLAKGKVVEYGDGMTMPQQFRHKHGAQIAAAAGNQYVMRCGVGVHGGEGMREATGCQS